MELSNKFWKKVASEDLDGHWMWVGATYMDGYGKMSIIKNGKRTTISAHRIAWELAHGPLTEGKFVCHTCGVKACVNPAHLMVTSDRAATVSGQRNGNGKLTEEAVSEIRRLYETGKTQLELALQFEVSQATIFLVVNRKTWKS